jgi:DNA-binding NarL/FixJ family response regulator
MNTSRMRTVPSEKLRVVVADDHDEGLQEVVSLLEVEFLVVATVNKSQAVLECVRRYQPDVVVLDLEIPILNGIETATKLMQMPSPPVVVICSDQIDPKFVEDALQAGAIGYVFRTRMAQDLVEAVKTAARGETFISSRCSLGSEIGTLELLCLFT